MSKLGKKPISIPKDTKVKVENGKLVMTGPKGSRELTDSLRANIEYRKNNGVLLTGPDDVKKHELQAS